VGLFTRNKVPEIGIDISSSAVKVLELSRDNNRYRVEGYAIEPLPAEAVVDRGIADAELVARAIRVALKRSGCKGKQVATAVPASAAISKTLYLPAGLREDEMEVFVFEQAEQHIPYPLHEVNLDFQTLGPGKRPDEIEVLLVASRSEHVHARTEALNRAGLIPRVMDVDSYALESAFPVLRTQLPAGSGTIAVVDVGASTTSLSVLQAGRIVYTREQVFGGKQLTDEIIRRYGLSSDEAERAVRHGGGLPEGYEEEVLTPFREAMAQQATRSLQFFFGSGQFSSVDHILLSGGCAALPGAVDLLEEQTGTPTSIANPFGNMSLASGVKSQQLTDDAPTLTIACGLAMRRFPA